MKDTLHPEVERLLDTVLRADSKAGAPTLEAIRTANLKTGELLGGPGEGVARVWNGIAQTSHGPRDLRWYLPFEEAVDSLILFVHGGGWVSGTLDSYDTLCRALALRTRRPVASLAYSLSPEARHPKAIEEVADVIQGMRELSVESGFPVGHLTVCGDSAGAFLIATAMHHLAEKSLCLPDTAVFIYPIADVSMRYESYKTFASGYSLTASKMQWYWDQYLGTEDAAEDDPYLSPVLSRYLPKFPRSMIITAEFDPLRDEGMYFGDRLRNAGIQVERVDVPGQIHGFLRFRKALTDLEWGPDAVMERIGRFLDSTKS